MRRSFVPITLIALGLFLIFAYLVTRKALPAGLDQAANRSTSETIEPAQDGTATGVPVPTKNLLLADQPNAPGVVPTSQAPEMTGPSELAPTQSTPFVGSSATSVLHCSLTDCLSRFGVSGRLEDIVAAAEAGLPFGNYFNWWVETDLPLAGANSSSGEIQFWQMVPVNENGPGASWSTIDQALAARPGSIWIVGNEPDVVWQDNTTAGSYATIYHDIHAFIKERDPSAQIAIAGVAQPSPLRLRYLEDVLEAYREQFGESMPIDIWTIHAFILREQEDSWGVGIPPGMKDTSGLKHEITDHNDLQIFRERLISFREWMAAQGYGGKPLAVTEFGILHPEDFGFPPEVVTEFMLGAFEFLTSARGQAGDPQDDNRLFQNWFWYSVYDEGDSAAGNLYDRQSDKLTAVGQAFLNYLGGE